MQKELSRGFRILTAQNGREALEVLGKENVSLVVSDVMMPEMDGMELCMHIKDNPSFCHLPVVLLTAKSMTMHVEEGFQAARALLGRHGFGRRLQVGQALARQKGEYEGQRQVDLLGVEAA